MAMSPRDLLDRVRSKAKLGENNYEKSIAVKLNKPGKIKLQLIALDSENLFKSRTQHFIQTLPDNEDPNEKVMVVDCQGDGCPVCDAMNAFKNSGVTVEQINEAYKPKYPYPKLRNFMIQPEHFILGVRVLADNAEDGTYLPKDEALGSTQLLQLSKSALNSLMAAYDDFISDSDEDEESLPPLFGVFEDGAKTVKSLTVNLRVQVQGAWSYLFTFGKAVESKLEEIDTEKLKFLEDTTKPSDDYVEKVIKRIHQIQNYFTGASNLLDDDDEDEITSKQKSVSNSKTNVDTKSAIEDLIDDDDFDIDSL